MIRHPAGILALILAMLLLATGLGGAITGEWGLDHVRGRIVIPGLAVALILLAVAGPRRGVVAVIGEGAAVLSVLLALNYARLVVKWSGNGLTIDQALGAGLGFGFLVAAILLWRSRPAAQDEDWHGGSAILGGALWIVGLRQGAGSRAGLGLTVLILGAVLSVGFETVPRAEALGRAAYQRYIAPSPADTSTSTPRHSAPATGASSGGPASWPAPVSPDSTQSSEDSATSNSAASEPPNAARAPRWGKAASEASEGSPASGARRGWISPVSERRLPAGSPPRVREAATPVRTRISPVTGGRMGPWSGVLTDRPLPRFPRVVAPLTPGPNPEGRWAGEAQRVIPTTSTAISPPAPTMTHAMPGVSPRRTLPSVPDGFLVEPFVGPLPGPLERLAMGPWRPALGDRAVLSRVASPRPSASATTASAIASTITIDSEPPEPTTTRTDPRTAVDRPARPAGRVSSRAWADPSFAVAADAGAMQAGTGSVPPTVLYGVGTLLVVLLAARRFTAAGRDGPPPVTATTGNP